MSEGTLLCGSIIFSYPVADMTIDVIQGTKMTFGTSESCTVRLPWGHISDQHFELRGSKFVSDKHNIPVIIKRLPTSDEVRLNGHTLVATKPQVLRKGDEVSLGPHSAPSAVFRFLSFDSRSIYARYDFGQTLGKGTFGTVQKIKNRITNKIYAVKRLPYGHTKSRNSWDGALNEINTMKILDHTNLISAVEAFREPGFFFIVMEAASFGSLQDHMSTVDYQLSARDVMRCTHQILSGIAWLHRLNITHRDIKPKNILVFQRSPIQIKIGDFGLAHRTTQEYPIISGEAGTSPFMAPEIKEEAYYTNAVDIYATGITLWFMASPGSGPWPHEPIWMTWPDGRQTKQAIQWSLFKTKDELLQAFIRCLLAHNPKERPRAFEAMYDKFFTGLC